MQMVLFTNLQNRRHVSVEEAVRELFYAIFQYVAQVPVTFFVNYQNNLILRK